jgi:hypothetical protein
LSMDRVDLGLAELRARTDGVRARPGFQARVMVAIAEAGANAFRAELTRAARWFVPVALATTLLTVGWARQVEPVTSSEVAQAELGWVLSW